MPTAPVDGIELHYDVIGDDGVDLILIMGLGAQMIAWDDDFCLALVDRGFRVIRFDNRDVGLSSKIEGGEPVTAASLAAAFAGAAVPSPPYLLADMAADAAALLDHLGIEAAHVVGASMGGMIAQTLAIEHPERVLSLTSIMSTTGDRSVGQAKPEAMAVLLAARPTDREQAIEQGVAGSRVIASPDQFDEDRARERVTVAYDRCFYPAGIARQMLAVLASGDRTEGLRQLEVPTLVIHGDVDPLVTLSGGQATADAIDGAELLVLEGMGHDLPPAYWPPVVEAITKLAARS